MVLEEQNSFYFTTILKNDFKSAIPEISTAIFKKLLYILIYQLEINTVFTLNIEGLLIPN